MLTDSMANSNSVESFYLDLRKIKFTKFCTVRLIRFNKMIVLFIMLRGRAVCKGEKFDVEYLPKLSYLFSDWYI